ncbi:MAG: hypothetical protein LBI87_00210 [Candidatus Accumulibacter sp.]|nr:hypothetical protein [Accumulibacter sp.]
MPHETWKTVCTTALFVPSAGGLLQRPLVKAMLDAEVERLCAIDGGIKVYETVKLPAEKFNEWGQINFYKPTQGENALGPEYIFINETHYDHKGNPRLFRYRHQVIRRTDNKSLGETILYGRGGGDLPGPWHGSSFHCPEIQVAGREALFKQIFITPMQRIR